MNMNLNKNLLIIPEMVKHSVVFLIYARFIVFDNKKAKNENKKFFICKKVFS